jgi:tetratricopeptide (TPR) repeat protein
MASSINNLKELIELAERRWYRPVGLAVTMIIVLLVVSAVLLAMKAGAIVNLIIYGILLLIISLAWLASRRVPRTRTGKVGFAVSISCETEEERAKIKEDFINSLRELLMHGKVGRSFQFIVILPHVAEKIIDPDTAQALRVKSKAHFVLYGRVRVRELGGRQHHVLNLGGIVAHSPIPEDVSQKISQEFAELLPQRVRIAAENDLLSFEFTSEWTDCVAKYIIGIAAAHSGDLGYAEELFRDVFSRLQTKGGNFPVFVKLKTRIPLRLSELYEARADAVFQWWTKKHDPSLVVQLGEHLDKIDIPYSDRYRVRLLRSIFLFLHSRDVNGAMRVLKRCKHEKEATWLLNLAFLLAYAGKPGDAIRRYRSALSLPLQPRVSVEIEEFICWVLEQEPDKYQLYYCLGFINWKLKGDTKQAIHDFQRFLELGNESEFETERNLTRTWLAQLDEIGKEFGPGLDGGKFSLRVKLSHKL